MTTTVHRVRRSGPLLLASVVGLTLFFTAQEAVRLGIAGREVDWGQALAINALDWVVWGLQVPLIVLVAQRLRLDGGGSRTARILGWLALGVAFCVVQGVLTGLVVHYGGARFFGLGNAGGPGPVPIGRFLVNWGLSTSSLNLLIFGMTAGALHAWLYYRDLRARELREADLQTRLANAELSVLRTQLQPHFLFNALHTVSSLMVKDVAAAQRVVTALGDLLRASLDHTWRQELPLRDELGFVERYLDIQRARFRARLTVDVSVPDDLLDALVPSFVLQPLVENAIRHGIEPNADGGRIWVRAAQVGAAISISVRDDGSTNGAATPAGGGIGLANIEARLSQLYGTEHTFRAGRGEDGHFDVTMTLPFHTVAGSR